MLRPFAAVAAAGLTAVSLSSSPVAGASAHRLAPANPVSPAATITRDRQCSVHPASPGKGWKLVERYTFNQPAGSGVNTKLWQYDVGTGIFGTGEVETMTNSTTNVHEGDCALHITAVSKNGAWTSGRIQTLLYFTAPAGGELLIKGAIKQPDPANGVGYWPAFWMLGKGQWPENGEFDILEDVNALSKHSTTFHCGVYPSGPCNEPNGIGSGLLPCSGCQTGFHVYQVVIDRRNPSDENLTRSLDGNPSFTVYQAQVPSAIWKAAVDDAHTIILDLAMGGGYPNALCSCTSPTAQTSSGGTFAIRYVAVYRKAA